MSIKWVQAFGRVFASRYDTSSQVIVSLASLQHVMGKWNVQEPLQKDWVSKFNDVRHELYVDPVQFQDLLYHIEKNYLFTFQETNRKTLSENLKYWMPLNMYIFALHPSMRS
jgi:hypothetical protein